MEQLHLTKPISHCNFELMSSKYAIDAKQSYRNSDRTSLMPRKWLFSVLFVVLAVATYAAVRSQVQLGLVLVVYAFILLPFGLVFAAIGLYYFYRYQLLSDIPTIKSDAVAATGLYEIIGHFAPEGGKPLLSPFSKTECVYYNVELYSVTNTEAYTGYGPVTRSIPLLADSAENGVPSYFTDGAGKITMNIATPLESRTM